MGIKRSNIPGMSELLGHDLYLSSAFLNEFLVFDAVTLTGHPACPVGGGAGARLLLGYAASLSSLQVL